MAEAEVEAEPELEPEVWPAAEAEVAAEPWLQPQPLAAVVWPGLWFRLAVGAWCLVILGVVRLVLWGLILGLVGLRCPGLDCVRLVVL